MQGSLLSVCISTYNRSSRCEKLVNQIFSLQDKRINVYVVDDNSTDDTLEKLNVLSYGGLHIRSNLSNIGPCKNWYKTINCGTGKYILHVLDRDTIDIEVLKCLLDLLEKYDVSGGYVGVSDIKVNEQFKKKAGIYIYQKGEAAFNTMAGVPIHPTGFLIKHEVWEKCNVKKYFYQTEKYGIYPHSYVMAFMALKGDLIQVQAKFFTYKYIGENSKSRFYEKHKKTDYWWLPKAVTETENKIILELYGYAGNSYNEEFVIKRFYDGLFRATITYKNTIRNKNEMKHYNLPTQEISDMNLIIISFWYYLHFWHVVGILKIKNKRRLKIEAAKKLMIHIKDIISRI